MSKWSEESLLVVYTRLHGVVNKLRRRAPRTARLAGGLLTISCIGVGGCRDCGVNLFVRGKLLDADSREPIVAAATGGRAFTDGQETAYTSPLIFDGSPNGPVSGDDGTFLQEFARFPVPCSPPPEFPRPDRVEITVVRDGCEQSFFIDINQETAVDVVDPEYYGDVIELIDPILVPLCEEE